MPELIAETVADYWAARKAWDKGDKKPLIDFVRRDQRAILDALSEYERQELIVRLQRYEALYAEACERSNRAWDEVCRLRSALAQALDGGYKTPEEKAALRALIEHAARTDGKEG